LGNLIAAIREGAKITEDGSYELRAATAALTANLSYFNNKITHWDPVNMKLV